MQLAHSTHHLDPSIAALVETAGSLLVELDRLPATVRAQLADGVTLGELRGLTSTQYEALYDIACGLCNQEYFLEAAPIAVQLAVHQPLNSSYLFLAASCMQRLSIYSNAAVLFSGCMMLDGGNAAAAFRLGECLLAMDFMEEADKAFDAAIAMSRGDPNARELQDMAYAAMDKFKQPH